MENTKDILSILSEYKGVIYDFDGTIATLSVDWSFLKNKLSEYIQHEHTINIEFTPLDTTLLFCREHFGIATYQMLLAIIEEVEVSSGISDENIALITYINNSSQYQAIYSMNTSSALDIYLGNIFGEKNPFHPIISKNTCKAYKPNSVDIESIYTSWGMKIEDVVYIGNSESDRISGEMAQVRTLII